MQSSLFRIEDNRDNSGISTVPVFVVGKNILVGVSLGNTVMGVAMPMQALPLRIKFGCGNTSRAVGSAVVITGQSLNSFSLRVFVGNVGNVAVLDIVGGVVVIVGIVGGVVMFRDVGILVIFDIVGIRLVVSIVVRVNLFSFFCFCFVVVI